MTSYLELLWVIAANNQRDKMKISETTVKKIAQYLISAGCESALVSSLWEQFENGDEDGVVKAINWAWYSTTQ